MFGNRKDASLMSWNSSTCNQPNLLHLAHNEPVVVSGRLSDIRFGGGRYEVGTVCTSNHVLDVRDGRDTTNRFMHNADHQHWNLVKNVLR